MYCEAMSTNYPNTYRLRNHAEVRETLLRHMNFGAAGILSATALDEYRAMLIDVAYAGFTDDDPPQDVVDAFFLRNRLRRWYGTTLEADHLMRLHPLYSPIAGRLGFQIGPRDRHGYWIYRQLFARLDRRVTDPAFASGGWPTTPVPGRTPEPRQPRNVPSPIDPAIGDADQPLKASTEPKTAVVEWRRLAEGADVETMRRYLLDDPANPVFDIIDRSGLETALDVFDRLAEPSKKQVYGALSAALWLGGHELTVTPT
jgi:hypothetical protein